MFLTTDPLDPYGTFYNNYYLVLRYVYFSGQYSQYDSNQSVFIGGVDRIADEFTIGDTVNPIIFSKLTNAYNYASVNDLVNDFNGNIYAYYAENAGPGTTIPEVKATANNIFTSVLGAGIGDRIVARLNSTTVIATYNVLTTTNQNIIVNDVKNLINSLNVFPGNATLLPTVSGTPISNTGIRLAAPVGAGASYNGNTFSIFREDFVLATAIFIFTASSPGLTSFKITANGVNLGTYSLGLSGETPTQLATGYAALVNSGTGIHGFTASTNGATLLTITAPPYTGASYNTLPCVLTVIQGTVGVLNPNQSFIGGQTNPTLIGSTVSFTGGEDAVLTTKVRFYTPPPNQSAPEYGTGKWAFNGETLTYDYNSGQYNILDNCLGGIDPTVGKLTVDILYPSLALWNNIYTDGTPQNYFNRQAVVNAFNAANPLPVNFQISLFGGSPLAAFLSPTDSFSFFNGFKFRYSYMYVSSQSTGGQYADYEDIITTFTGGIDPTLTSYEGIFQQGDIGTFVTSNPCEPTTAEQECLSNKDITNIIRHIDRIVK